ncbi:MAG: sigma 54-interacting transcriptional regulator [Deltaproteobacteria bacterium]|nr:sigma 54-interacting transcriptional regulator [Deltaproteobacteria bacterium]
MTAKTIPHVASGLPPIRGLRLEVVEGPSAGLTQSFSKDSVSIGTAIGNDLVIEDPKVSRYHVELGRVGDRISVRDLGSTNGTWLGGVRLKDVEAPPRTELRLGESRVRIEDAGTVEIELLDDESLGRFRGRTPEARRLMALMQKAAKSDVPVLVLGETGTGKEVIARTIHEHSARARGPLETVDCGALMPTLVASELFGHERGAFTGADRQHVGAFERAHGGTLFLDEIGELPSSLQPALLGVLERKSFRRLGGTKQIPVDVRVVAATHRDLRTEVNAGTFRQDLYFRLAVIVLKVPGLRERAGDLPILVEHFLREAGHSVSATDLFTPEMWAQMRTYRWPGNVRELRNFVDAAMALGEAPELERDEHLPSTPKPQKSTKSSEPEEARRPENRDESRAFPSEPLESLIQLEYKDARQKILDEFERLYLASVLERAENNITLAAQRARIHRTYLIQMLKRHNLR